MTRQMQISIIISILLHILVLLTFAGVKIYTEGDTEDSMSVTFVSPQKTKPLQRSVSVRPRISLSKSPQSLHPEQYAVHPEYRSPVESYVIIPEETFSAVGSAGQEVFHDTGVKRPAVELRGHLSSPISTGVPEGSSPWGPQIPSRISGGHELLSDAAPAPARPDVEVTGDVLQSFARSVRRMIEANKKYPTAAQAAGIEGRTSVRMVILKDGRLGKVEIVRSSGYEILDKAALQSVREAAPFPPIPEKTRREEIHISVTLIFKIT